MPADVTELPLFPLQTVLFPGGPLQLRVFEPRYLDMVARCLRGTNRFGVVAIASGAEVGDATTYDVGTTAEIVDWHQEEHGVLGLRALGREVFRLVKTRREPDGLYVGEVTLLDAPRALPPLAEHAPLVALLRQLVDQLPQFRMATPAFDDAFWVGGRLIELLPLALAFKQSLLEIEDPHARLERLAAALRPAD